MNGRICNCMCCCMRTADLLHDQKGLQAYWPKLNDDITRHKLHEMKFKIVFHFVDLIL